MRANRITVKMIMIGALLVWGFNIKDLIPMNSMEVIQEKSVNSLAIPVSTLERNCDDLIEHLLAQKPSSELPSDLLVATMDCLEIEIFHPNRGRILRHQYTSKGSGDAWHFPGWDCGRKDLSPGLYIFRIRSTLGEEMKNILIFP